MPSAVERKQQLKAACAEQLQWEMEEKLQEEWELQEIKEEEEERRRAEEAHLAEEARIVEEMRWAVEEEERVAEEAWKAAELEPVKSALFERWKKSDSVNLKRYMCLQDSKNPHNTHTTPKSTKSKFLF